MQEYKFNRWCGKIAHATGQLSLCATVTEAPCPRAHDPQEKPPQWEAHVPPLESDPHSSHLEKAWAQQWPSTANFFFFFKKKKHGFQLGRGKASVSGQRLSKPKNTKQKWPCVGHPWTVSICVTSSIPIKLCCCLFNTFIVWTLCAGRYIQNHPVQFFQVVI